MTISFRHHPNILCFAFVALFVSIWTTTASTTSNPPSGRNCTSYHSSEFNCPMWKHINESSLPPQYHCVSISGFPSREFAANGIYCSSSSSPRNETNSSDPYTYHPKPNSLRYELRHEAVDRIWTLLRVIKTRNEKWIGTPLYATTVEASSSSPAPNNHHRHSPNSFETTMIPPRTGWMAIRHNPTKRSLDWIKSEPPPIVSERKEIPMSYRMTLWMLHEFRRSEDGFDDDDDVCSMIVCDEFISKLRREEEETEHSRLLPCSYTMRLSAKLAEILNNHTEAAKRYERARSCVQETINDYASKRKPIPREHRWELADLGLHVARSRVQTGSIDLAIDAVLMGLAHSPEETQRRELFLGLGDLTLFAGDIERAKSSYQMAREAVRRKGGQIDPDLISNRGDLSPIADLLAEQQTLRGPQSVAAESPKQEDYGMHHVSYYHKSRAMLMLGTDHGSEWDETVNDWIRSLAS